MNIEKTNQDNSDSLEAKIEQLTEELREAKEQLKQQEELAFLGEMSGEIFHDLRNYLGLIRDSTSVNVERSHYLESYIPLLKRQLREDAFDELFADLIGEKDLISALKESLVNTKNQVNQILRITEEINIYRYEQKGKVVTYSKPDLVETNINELVAECLTLGCKAGEIKKQNKGEDKIELNLETDYDSSIDKLSLPTIDIRRILMNLIDNAYYAVYEKNKQEKDYSPTISVTTKLNDDGINITLRDNGTGIPQEIKRNFAKAFFTTKPPGEGSGIGLSIVKKLLRKNQISIKIKSEENEYTEVILSIPIPKEK